MKLLRQLLWIIPSFGFFLWSYALTDRALTLTQIAPFLHFQQFMWRFADNHVLQAWIYVVIILGLIFSYLWLLRDFKKYPVLMIIIPVIFAFSMNALSYDLYNYIFDAKLVLVYHLDPHTSAAIDFIKIEPWVAFMRNIVYPTTYGYAWTAISLVPSFLGFGKLLTTFLAFKLYALLAFGLMLLLVRRMLKQLAYQSLQVQSRLISFFAMPLVLIEILSSAHNDVWMMLAALFSFWLVFPQKQTKNYLLKLILSIAFLFISIQVKRATLLLIPIWLLFVLFSLKPQLKFKALFMDWWGDLAAILMFLPLFTELSRRFHPWYLIWPLTFLPFVKSKFIKTLLICFSITSLLRYVPFLYTGIYSVPTEQLQVMVTWSAVPVALIIYLMMRNILDKRRLK